jgi:hypothetical protein
MNKKIVFLIVLLVMPIFTVFGQQYTRERDFKVQRTSDGNSVIITGYKGRHTDVNIPPQIQRRTVVGIGDRAFIEKNLTNVTIPNSVTSIERSAFYNNKLTSINIPGSVTSIGEHTFRNNQLASITIPDSVTYIGDNAFADNQLTSVNIGNGIAYIGEETFRNNQLTSVTIPNNVTSIRQGAFANNQLTSVIIPNSVTSISQRAFADNQLTSVNIPDNVTLLDRNAFENNQLDSTPITAQQRRQAEAKQLEQTRLPELYQQAGNNFGNLRNTAWRFYQPFGNTFLEGRIDFGNDNFMLRQNQHDPMFAVTIRGNFRVSGDTVLFITDDGIYFSGSLVGNTLTVNRANVTVNQPVYNRIN